MTEQSSKEFREAVDELHETMKAIREEAAATRATAMVARETAEMIRGILLGPPDSPEKGMLFRFVAFENVAKQIAKNAKFVVWLLGVLVAILAARMGIDVTDLGPLVGSPPVGAAQGE